MRYLFLSVALALFLCGSALTAAAQTAREVLVKYVAFTGGAAAWQEIQTVTSSGTYNYNGIVFPFTAYAKRPDKYKFIVPFNGKYFAQAFDGVQGWKIDAFKGETTKTPLTGAAARALLNEADVELEPPFLDYEKKGHRAVLAGEDTAGGVRFYIIDFSRATGEKETLFFDAASGALIKKIAPSKNSELDGALLETTFSDYRKVQGVRLPFTSVSKTNGPPVLIIVVKNIAFNKPVSEAIFER